MATSSSASTYISKINSAYPVAGVDNDTQGFRDNFKNIKLSLDLTDQDVYDLKINSVVLTNPVNDFNNNVIKQAVFQDCSMTVYDGSDTIETGDVDIDYQQGSFQKFEVSSGTHWFSVLNWPGSGKYASLVLSVTTSSTETTYVNFNATNVYNISNEDLPFNITGKQNSVFHIWNDGDSGNLYVKPVNRTNQFTKPITLASYTTSTLASLTNVSTGSMVFLTSGYNKPVFYSNGSWYAITGTAVIL